MRFPEVQKKFKSWLRSGSLIARSTDTGKRGVAQLKLGHGGGGGNPQQEGRKDAHHWLRNALALSEIRKKVNEPSCRRVKKKKTRSRLKSSQKHFVKDGKFPRNFGPREKSQGGALNFHPRNSNLEKGGKYPASLPVKNEKSHQSTMKKKRNTPLVISEKRKKAEADNFRHRWRGRKGEGESLCLDAKRR